MAKSQKTIKEFALIGFILLAVLFGMQIMVFIFGSLGSTDILEDVTQSLVNETGGYLNVTGYTLTMASQANFSGSAVVTEVFNVTTILLSGNYTVNADTGVVTNASTVTYANVTISYSSAHKTEAEVTSESISNDSLQAISAYSSQADTQFTTLGIAITLILLVAVFLFFWAAFMGKGKGEDSSAGTFS